MRERCWLTLKMPSPEAAWRCAARECEAFRWAFLALPCCLSKKGLGVPPSGQLFGLSAVTAVRCFADEAFMLPSAAPPGQALLITRYPAEQCRQKSHLKPGRWRPHQRLSRRNAQSRRHKPRKLGLSALPSVFRKPRLLLETLPSRPFPGIHMRHRHHRHLHLYWFKTRSHFTTCQCGLPDTYNPRCCQADIPCSIHSKSWSSPISCRRHHTVLYRMNVIFCCPRRLQKWTSCAKLRFVSMDTGLRERRTSGQLGLRRPGPLRTQIHSSMIPRHCKLPVVSQRSPGMYMQSNLSIHQSTCSPRLMLRNIPVAHLLVNCSMGPRTSNSTPLQVTFNREALLADFDAGSPDFRFIVDSCVGGLWRFLQKSWEARQSCTTRWGYRAHCKYGWLLDRSLSTRVGCVPSRSIVDFMDGHRRTWEGV